MIGALATTGKLQHFPVMVQTMVLRNQAIEKHSKNKAFEASFIIEWE
ncbi:MAG: hypothetical protein ABFC42_00165 [Sulfuricella sp.]